ncbi:uncharacterized protein LOC125379278 [Haliotis rufescens]|uniref:uncharacterized protein LOC125379278 n=1 Tax=Haliotis rufescens TaxID=6454 RepID=UPI00201F01D4|nr:uncharacterized protein LOC125379278 [Haliotis rufescens]
MDIELHNKSMLTYPGTPDPPIACFKKTINFHDFSKGLVAMKFVGKNVCFVKTSDETYEEIVKVIDRIKKGDNAPKSIATEEWVTPRTQVPTEEVARRVGSKIANFCSGCKVYVLQDGKVIRTAADVPRVTRRGRDDSPSSLSNHRRRSCGWLAVCFGCSVGSREKEESHSGADQPVGLNRQPSSE